MILRAVKYPENLSETTMPYKHIEIEALQFAKRGGFPCGDVVVSERTREATLIVVCDGIGSGIKANVAATFTASRLLELTKHGFSIRGAFRNLVQTMHQAKTTDLPYSAFTVCHILNDGKTSILNYEMPAPIAVENQYAYLLPQRNIVVGREVVTESYHFLEKGQRLFLLSDGITQAGMGKVFPLGWKEEGVVKFLNKCFQLNYDNATLAARIADQSKNLDGSIYHDDATVVTVSARDGTIVNIWSGPPLDKTNDAQVVRHFMSAVGIKVVSGSTTASVAARHLDAELKVENGQIGFMEPPRYLLRGADLVTEGAITLNQVYNLIDDNVELEAANDKSGVMTLYSLLKFADRVNFTVGRAENPAHKDIKFSQLGVLPRAKIIPMIAEKLKAQGKLVVVQYV